MSDEGGHWYKRDGSPCYEVPARGGGMRGINLRWDRGLNLVPSVTTVLNVVAKPALTNWMVQQGIWAALTGTRLPGEDDAAYIERILADSKQQAISAAEEGTRIHNAIEMSFAGYSPATDTLAFIDTHPSAAKLEIDYSPHVKATREELKRLFPEVDDWISEKSFAHPLGFGGKVDLHSPSTGIVVDFKTKDGDFTELDAYGKPKKLAWDQNIQLAAYQVGLGIRPIGYIPSPHDESTGITIDVLCSGPEFVQCANIFVSRTHPGAVASHVWSADDVARGWRQFECALALWKEMKEYDPAF